MRAGIATMHVLQQEWLVARADSLGNGFRERLLERPFLLGRAPEKGHLEPFEMMWTASNEKLNLETS